MAHESLRNWVDYTLALNFPDKDDYAAAKDAERLLQVADFWDEMAGFLMGKLEEAEAKAKWAPPNVFHWVSGDPETGPLPKIPASHWRARGEMADAPSRRFDVV